MKNSNKSITVLASLLFMLTLAFSSFAMTPTNDVCECADSDNRVLDVDLGLEYSVFKDDNKIGLAISNVFSNSVGSALGLQNEDLLIGVGNQPIVLASLEKALNAYEAGDDVLLRIERNGRYQEVKAKMPAMGYSSNEEAFLGLEVLPLASKNVVGATIKRIDINSSAEYAGLQKNDIILGINNQPVVGDNISEIVTSFKAGDLVLLRVQRASELYMIKSVLGKNENKNSIQLSSK